MLIFETLYHLLKLLHMRGARVKLLTEVKQTDCSRTYGTCHYNAHVGATSFMALDHLFSTARYEIKRTMIEQNF